MLVTKEYALKYIICFQNDVQYNSNQSYQHTKIFPVSLSTSKALLQEVCCKLGEGSSLAGYTTNNDGCGWPLLFVMCYKRLAHYESYCIIKIKYRGALWKCIGHYMLKFSYNQVPMSRYTRFHLILTTFGRTFLFLLLLIQYYSCIVYFCAY